ncbi:MAG: FecR domain-containing protein [Acidobacteria bacterium]|nr:FecR domain-containing protein [Acidobacteriota bacterium]
MRSGKTLFVALLSLLFTFLLTGATALAAEEDVNENEYEEKARVMRVTLLRGEVSLRRDGNVEWETAKINLPLVEGDMLATGRDSHMEIQVDARNFVRLGENSVLKVVTLRDEGIALSLSEGTATLRLARFDPDREYFEIDAPKTTMAAEKRGLFRLDVSPQGVVRVTVREDGRARIYSQTSGFVLRNNRAARLTYDAQGEGDWELSAAATFDGWDNWNDEREQYLASRLRYEGRERYYDPEVWGAEELDVYGDWSYTPDYGYVWRPHVTVINKYRDWAPYRYGHWQWVAPYGWTWIPDEDWGWAPYHYGRWVYVNGYWCWAPRGYGYHYKRAWWRPALVAFVYIDTSYGQQVCWYPLRHGQRDPRGRWWSRQFDRLEPLRRNDISNLRRANPALLRAVSTLPEREFGAQHQRARSAATDIAQRTLSEEPVRGRLRVTPSDVQRVGAPRAGAPGAAGRGRRTDALSTNNGAGNPEGRAGLSIARPAPLGPARSLPDRATGAAPRTPGAPLDAELRRTRVFNGREPRPQSNPSAGTNESGAAAEAGTGAVLRPSRTGRRPAASTGEGESNGEPNAGALPSTRVRPTRPTQATEEPRSEPGEAVLPGTRRPDGSVRGNSESPRVRPERPSVDRTNSPEVFERREPRVRPSAPESRAEPTERREEAPAPRLERHIPREERAPERTAPPAREERVAPPAREERPAPRQESAPQREERSTPREDRPAPAREEPPAQREERPAPAPAPAPSRSEESRPSRSEDSDRPARPRPDNRR